MIRLDDPDAADKLSRERTPVRMRHTRSVTGSGIVWLPPEQVPGAILSPSAERELQERLRRLREWEARSRASAQFYVICR